MEIQRIYTTASIRQYIYDSAYTQAEFAAKCGVSQSVISNILSLNPRHRKRRYADTAPVEADNYHFLVRLKISQAIDQGKV